METYRKLQSRKVPSPSTHIDEKSEFTLDKIVYKNRATYKPGQENKKDMFEKVDAPDPMIVEVANLKKARR